MSELSGAITLYVAASFIYLILVLISPSLFWNWVPEICRGILILPASIAVLIAILQGASKA